MTPQPSLLQTLNKYLDPNTPIGRFIRVMMWTIVGSIAIGLLMVVIQPIANRITSLLLALACLLLGAFIGFLFGIPRVLQADGGPGATTPSTTNPQTTPNESNAYQQQVNTNLEQISDWLTKIIVGLGLVNLYRIPELLRDTSELIARGIVLPNEATTAKNSVETLNASIGTVTIFANAILLYFPVLGFLVGYLITRIFLSGVFRVADTGGLMVNKQDVGLDVNVGPNAGGTIALTDVVKNLVNVVSTNLTTPIPTPGPVVETSRASTPIPKRILWADDTPTNNIIEREALTKAGIDVVAVDSTEQALTQLSSGSAFDLVISDLGRPENGMFNPIAGINLIQQIRAGNSKNIRIIIYTSKKGFDQYNAQARQAGANDVVYGSRILMKSIGLAEGV